MKTEEHYYCTRVGGGFSCVFTVIGCSGTCGEALLLGVEKKFQVTMSRAGRSAVSNLAAFNLLWSFPRNEDA